MPTITTTVTSACASGVVTTQTTTQATPEAAKAKQTLAEAIKGKVYDGGRSAQVCLISATTQKGFDAIVGCFQAVNGMMQGTDGFCNMVKTGPMTASNIMVFGSPDAFYKCEALFGQLEQTKVAIAEGVKLDAHVMGNIPALQRSKWAVWDEVPGFNIHFDTPNIGTLGSSGGRDGSGDVFGWCGEFQCQNEEDLMTIASGHFMEGIVGLAMNALCQHQYVFFPGNNKMIFCATFAKADYMEFLKAADRDLEFGAEAVRIFNTGPGQMNCFGADAEISAGLNKWIVAMPTWNFNMDASIGGVDFDGICGCTIDFFYGSSADRNAAQGKFGELVEVSKQHGVMTFCTIDRGDCGSRMIFVAPNTAAWKAVNDTAAADPTFGETVIGKAMIVKGTPFGSFTTEYYKELFGWEAASPQFKWDHTPPFHFQAQAYSASDASLVGQQTLTFETEAACEASLTGTIAFGNVFTECGASVFDFRASANTYQRLFIFPTAASLATANDLFGARAEETAALLAAADVKTIMFGAETAETAALLDVWRASPTFDIVSMPLKTGFV